MALKNFIKQGTYLTFERIDYSKTGRYLQANIVVYADETKSEAILQTSIYIGGSYEALPIKKTIRTEDELLDEAPEYLGINTDEAILIAIDNPTSDYAKQINNFIIYKAPDNQVSIQSPLYIYDIESDSVLERRINKFEKIDDFVIKTRQQFEKYIDSSNIVKSFYEILKRMPLYKDCEDA